MKKILLIKRRALGDTVLMTATVELLKSHIPDAEITVLVPAVYAEIFLHNPNVAQVWSFEERGFLRLLWRIRRAHFCAVFDLHSHGKNHYLTKYSGAPIAQSQVQNEEAKTAYGLRPNALEWDALFLRKFFPAISGPVQPKLYFRPEELERAREFWRSRGMVPERTIFLGLGASRATKRWPPEHFARFAELVRDRLDLTVAIVAGDLEQEALFSARVLNYLRVKGFRPQHGPKDTGGLVFHSGASVREVAALLATCRAYVGNDSGPKHLALAAGVPTLTFFGPEDPMEWHPYSSPRHQILFEEKLACRTEDNGRWCGIQQCIVERHRCMAELRPEDAFARFEGLSG